MYSAICYVLQAVRYLTELGSLEVGGAEGVVDIAPAYLILSEAAIRKSIFFLQAFTFISLSLFG